MTGVSGERVRLTPVGDSGDRKDARSGDALWTPEAVGITHAETNDVPGSRFLYNRFLARQINAGGGLLGFLARQINAGGGLLVL